MAATGVQKLSGHDMESYLKKHPTVLYRYQANRPGLAFLLVLALIASVSGVIIWLSVGLPTIWHTLGVGSLILTALVLTGLVSYWAYFPRLHYVAVSDRHLLIGRGREVVAIDWGALNVEALDFNSGGDSPFRGVLSLQLGGERYRLRLFNGFAILRNLEGFISTLLTNVREEVAG